MMCLKFDKYLIILLVIFVYSCSEGVKKPYTFVQLCDTQLGQGGYEHDVNAFEQAVKQINALHPDFVLVCGDLVQNPNEQSFSDFKNIQSGLKMPCYCVPGNHDIGTVPNDSTLRYYRETIGKDYYEFQHKGTTFIITNSQLWKANVAKESEAHNTWFQETLKRSGVNHDRIVVIGHYPLYIKAPEEAENYFNLPLVKRKDLLTRFVQNNVLAYLSGHMHEAVINRVNNIQLVSGEATSKGRNASPLGFRLWTVSSDTIQQQFVALEAPAKKQSEAPVN